MFNVLIVDDEKWTRGVIKAFGDWEKYGMNIIGEVENGQEAINILEKTRCNVIITDMDMPGMNGILSPPLSTHLRDNLEEYKTLAKDLPDEMLKAKEIYGHTFLFSRFGTI